VAALRGNTRERTRRMKLNLKNTIKEKLKHLKEG